MSNNITISLPIQKICCLLPNGIKNNNTSSHMPLDHCCPFGLSLLPSGLKKKFLEEGDPRDLFSPVLGGSGRKTTALVRDHEYFIATKFHQNPSSGSGEEVENVKKFTDGRRTDGRRTVRYDNSSLEPSAQVS